MEEARGFLVTDVSRGSPAQKARVQGGSSLTNIDGREITLGGDVILKIDENTVRKLDDVLTYLEREKKVGDAVQLTILRNGVTENISLTLDPRPTAIESQGSLPQQEDVPPGPKGGQEQPPLTDQLYDRCLEIAGKDICDFMFQR